MSFRPSVAPRNPCHNFFERNANLSLGDYHC